jgi:hypothetical protein
MDISDLAAVTAPWREELNHDNLLALNVAVAYHQQNRTRHYHPAT